MTARLITLLGISLLGLSHGAGSSPAEIGQQAVGVIAFERKVGPGLPRSTS